MAGYFCTWLWNSIISKNIDMNVIVVTDEMCPKELYYKDIIFNQVENK